jgi:hypothetical protein
MRGGGAEVEGDFRSDLSNVQNEVTKSNYVTSSPRVFPPKKTRGSSTRTLERRWGER